MLGEESQRLGEDETGKSKNCKEETKKSNYTRDKRRNMGVKFGNIYLSNLRSK